MLTALAVAACGPVAAAPAGSTGAAHDHVSTGRGMIPQPDLARIDLGADAPGFDGSGDFYSYDSDLSPDATMGAYAGQLLAAGYRDSGRNGSWRVFIGSVLTVWVRVGTGGPPTSLLVRVQPTTAVDAEPDPQPSAVAGDPGSTGGSGGEAGSGGTHAASGATSQRRPDPPHASSGATAAGGGGTASGGAASGGTVSGGTASGGTVSGGTASGGTSGTGTGTTTGGGTASGGGSAGAVTGGAGSGGAATGTGTGSVSGDGKGGLNSR